MYHQPLQKGGLHHHEAAEEHKLTNGGWTWLQMLILL